MKAFITQCVKRDIPVIPVLLPGVTAIPESLLFLSEFHAVSFQNGIEDERALFRMEWGITGQKPTQRPANHPSPYIRKVFPDNADGGRTAESQTSPSGFADIFESFFQGFSPASGHPFFADNAEPDSFEPTESDSSEWAREWFVNVGENQGHILWDDCVQYECISAGGGRKYRDAIRKLKPGDVVYAYITGRGYVGYGEVVESAVPIRDFIIRNVPLLEQELVTVGLEENKDDLEFSDWVVHIEWLATYEREQVRLFIEAHCVD